MVNDLWCVDRAAQIRLAVVSTKEKSTGISATPTPIQSSCNKSFITIEKRLVFISSYAIFHIGIRQITNTYNPTI